MIPKTHGAKLTDVSDGDLAEILVRLISFSLFSCLDTFRRGAPILRGREKEKRGL